MRKPLVLALLSLTASFAACVGDDSPAPVTPGVDGGGIDGSPDGSPAPLEEASVIVPAPDAAPDANVGTGVTVTIRVNGATGNTGRVILHDVTGAVTADLKADATGKVAASPAPMLTVVIPAVDGDTLPRLVTYLGVAAGDQLTVDFSAFEPTSASTLNVTWPGVSTNAFDYRINAGDDCGGDSTTDPAVPLALGLYATCKGPISLLAASLDDSDRVLEYAFVKGQAVPAATQSAPVTLGAWAAKTNVTVTASNLPASATYKGRYGTVSDGILFPDPANPTGALDGAGLTFSSPVAFPDAVQAGVLAEIDRGSPDYSALALLSRQAPSATLAFDFADALPRITSGAITNATTARPEVSWTASAPLLPVTDGGYVAMRWTYRFNPDQADSPAWIFVVPPDATRVKAPALPADLAFAGPPGNWSDVEFEGVTFVESDSLPGYAAFRAIPVGAEPGVTPLSSFRRALPSNGKTRVTAHRVDLDGF